MQNPAKPEGRLDAKELTARHLTGIREEVQLLQDASRAPSLATVLVGDDAGSAMYVAMKQREASELGIQTKDIRLPGEISQGDLADTLRRLSTDNEIDAILLQYPLPAHLD